MTVSVELVGFPQDTKQRIPVELSEHSDRSALLHALLEVTEFSNLDRDEILSGLLCIRDDSVLAEDEPLSDGDHITLYRFMAGG